MIVLAILATLVSIVLTFLALTDDQFAWMMWAAWLVTAAFWLAWKVG